MLGVHPLGCQNRLKPGHQTVQPRRTSLRIGAPSLRHVFPVFSPTAVAVCRHIIDMLMTRLTLKSAMGFKTQPAGCRPGKCRFLRFNWLLLLLALLPAAHAAKPIALHPANPHYFLFRGKPAVLITGTEHYGAVLNLDFDYLVYLNTLKTDGLNLTRTFAGAYVEHSAAFNISNNTLAPLPNRFLCPWSRSTTPGYANGGHKFDLQNWDKAYFKRLKDFVAQAGKRGIVVEFVIFCAMEPQPHERR
jgi:hypothetical protein